MARSCLMNLVARADQDETDYADPSDNYDWFGSQR